MKTQSNGKSVSYNLSAGLAALTVVCLLSGCGKPQHPLDKLPDDAVILAFGDSLTYGTGASSGHDYPHLLAELSRKEVVNAGVPGETSGDGVQRLPAVLDEYEPDLVILMHGGNDFLKKISGDVTEKNIDAMVSEAKRRGMRVFLLGVPEPALFFLRSSPIYEGVAEKHGIPFDVKTLPSILGDNDLKSDPVHPNDKGYRLLAERVYGVLTEAGAF